MAQGDGCMDAGCIRTFRFTTNGSVSAAHTKGSISCWNLLAAREVTKLRQTATMRIGGLIRIIICPGVSVPSDTIWDQQPSTGFGKLPRAEERQTDR